MSNIAPTTPGIDHSPSASVNNVRVPPGQSLSENRSLSADSVAKNPVGPLLTPRQKMIADMESLIGVFLQIFITSRTAARDHNLYLRESIARMVELEADKMMSAALMQLVGGVIQGSAGIVSGSMQIGGAVSTLKSMRDGMKGIEPQMKMPDRLFPDGEHKLNVDHVLAGLLDNLILGESDDSPRPGH